MTMQPAPKPASADDDLYNSLLDLQVAVCGTTMYALESADLSDPTLETLLACHDIDDLDHDEVDLTRVVYLTKIEPIDDSRIHRHDLEFVSWIAPDGTTCHKRVNGPDGPDSAFALEDLQRAVAGGSLRYRAPKAANDNAPPLQAGAKLTPVQERQLLAAFQNERLLPADRGELVLAETFHRPGATGPCWHICGATISGETGDVFIGVIDGLPKFRLADSTIHDVTPPSQRSTEPGYPGIESGAEFLKGFVPPDYHIDGVAQAGFLYSVTAATGAGKTAVLLCTAALTAFGMPLGDREVRKGRVVYFAGENPDDIRMRWIAAAHHLEFDPETIDVHFIAGTFDINETFKRISADVEAIGGADMIVVDTSAAYFPGDDENSNVELGRHARNMRRLTTLPGSPVVFVACHPIKNADPSNLLPRGGGAFIAEVDGNLTINKSGDSVKLHWQGKYRGPEFTPIYFELQTVTAPRLVDSKGRPIPTVMATVLSKGEVVTRASRVEQDDDEALLAIDRLSVTSLADLAEKLDWRNADGGPDKERARRACDRLRGKKLIDVARKGWKTTRTGRDAASEVATEKHSAHAAARSAANLVASMAA